MADDAQAAGERVEALLAELRAQAGPELAGIAEELVGCLVELYGDGLTEIVRIVGEDAEAGPRLLGRLATQPLVESLLMLHDLHPQDAATRVRRALDELMPQLGPHAGTVEVLGTDERGVVRLRLERGKQGCNHSAAPVQAAIEETAAAAAPEAAGVELEIVEAPAELPLLQIGRNPAAARSAR